MPSIEDVISAGLDHKMALAGYNARKFLSLAQEGVELGDYKGVVQELGKVGSYARACCGALFLSLFPPPSLPLSLSLSLSLSLFLSLSPPHLFTSASVLHHLVQAISLSGQLQARGPGARQGRLHKACTQGLNPAGAGLPAWLVQQYLGLGAVSRWHTGCKGSVSLLAGLRRC